MNESQSIITVDPANEIAAVEKAEGDNFRVTQDVLGERAKLASDVLGIYDLVTRTVNIELGTSDGEQLALAVMLMMLAGCRFQLTMGILQNWRGRTGEALGPLRRASELCAFAFLIRRNPNFANVWSSASESDDAYKKYKDAFKTKVVFPKGDPILSRLYEIFDFASKGVHASIYSLASQTRDSGFQYFDIKDPLGPELIRTFMSIISGHQLILQVFIKAFDGSFTDKATVDEQFRILTERLQRHKTSSMDFAMSDISKSALERIRKKNA